MTETAIGSTEGKADFRRKIRAACLEGFDAGIKGAIAKSRYWPDTPLLAAYEAGYEAGEKAKANVGPVVPSGEPLDPARIEVMEELLGELLIRLKDIQFVVTGKT